MRPAGEDAPDLPSRAPRFIGAVWSIAVLAALGTSLRNVARVDARNATAAPAASLIPFPIPEHADRRGKRRPGGAAECQAPCADCATTRLGARTARVDAQGLLCMLDAPGDETLWSLRAGGCEEAAPPLPVARSGADVIFAAPTGTLYALDLDSGAPSWALRLGDRFLVAPAVADGRIAIDVERGDLGFRAMVNAATGEIVTSSVLQP